MNEKPHAVTWENIPFKTFVYQRALHSKNEHEKSLCWKYLDRREAISIIIKRIKSDVEEFTKTNDEMFSAIENKIDAMNLVEKSDECFKVLRLDIESLFLFVTIPALNLFH